MATSRPDDHRRSARVASRIREELSAALGRDLSDPRLAGVTISGVNVTDDLSIAHVAIVVLGDDASGARAAAARKVLASLEGGLRKRLAPKLGMRRVPALRFAVAETREESARLDRLLHEVSQELAPAKPEDKKAR